jgi:hypothetical protein
MSGLRTTVVNGKIVADAPADWPDGTDVFIQPTDEVVGLPDDDRPPTQEEINRTLALIDQIQGPFLTDEEWAAWEAARKAQKEYELSKWEERSRKIERLFE